MRSETYEAAESRFSWVRDASGGMFETMHLGLPAGVGLDGYYGYPIYSASSHDNGDSQERRLETLREMFEAYWRPTATITRAFGSPKHWPLRSADASDRAASISPPPRSSNAH